ncbi:MAG TPA: hypothetical protein PLY23_09475, partial [Alphaproteobacteria bacterium]|nr:hypothetical protein [Alphaproteobacteria bacterium]
MSWDYRLNTYLPLSSPKDIKGGPLKKQYIGYELYETTQKEIPLTGLDYEIGRTVPGLEDLSLYAGGYHFGAHHSKGMNGGRFRSVYAFNDYVSVNAEFQYDNIRKYSNFFGVCLTIPIGDDDSKKRKKLSPLERRMTSEVIRDVDIVSNAVKVTHKKEGKYIHIRNGQTGNYTAEQPGQDPLETPDTFKNFVEANNISFVVDEGGNVIPVSYYMQANKIEESSQLVKELSTYPKYLGKEAEEIENELLTGNTTSFDGTKDVLLKEREQLKALRLEEEQAQGDDEAHGGAERNLSKEAERESLIVALAEMEVLRAEEKRTRVALWKKTEDLRLAAEEADRQKKIKEAEALRLAAEEADRQLKLKQAEDKRLAAEEADRQLKLKEAEDKRLAAEEADRQLKLKQAEDKRLAAEEADRQLKLKEAEDKRLAAEEADRQLKLKEAEDKRLADEETDRKLKLKQAEDKRLAAEEADRQLKLKEAEDKRLADEEADRQLKLKEAEDKRLA